MRHITEKQQNQPHQSLNQIIKIIKYLLQPQIKLETKTERCMENHQMLEK